MMQIDNSLLYQLKEACRSLRDVAQSLQTYPTMGSSCTMLAERLRQIETCLDSAASTPVIPEPEPSTFARMVMMALREVEKSDPYHGPSSALVLAAMRSLRELTAEPDPASDRAGSCGQDGRGSEQRAKAEPRVVLREMNASAPRTSNAGPATPYATANRRLP